MAIPCKRLGGDQRGSMAGSQSRGKTERRRGGGFHRAAESARAPIREAAGRHGFAATEVILRWPEVVGEALSGLCHPVKVSYGRSRAMGATLVVAAEGARAPEVEMQAPAIIERVNGFYGYRAIARLRVTQTGARPGAPAGLAEAAAPFEGPEEMAASDPEGAARARRLAGGAENPGLRAALTRLGTYVLSQPRGKA